MTEADSDLPRPLVHRPNRRLPADDITTRYVMGVLCALVLASAVVVLGLGLL